jgi:hypothetical protein
LGILAILAKKKKEKKKKKKALVPRAYGENLVQGN